MRAVINFRAQSLTKSIEFQRNGRLGRRACGRRMASHLVRIAVPICGRLSKGLSCVFGLDLVSVVNFSVPLFRRESRNKKELPPKNAFLRNNGFFSIEIV